MMKKIIAIALSFVMLLSCFSITAFADVNFEKEKILFTEDFLEGANAVSRIGQEAMANPELKERGTVFNCVIVSVEPDIEFDTTHVIQGVRFDGIYYLQYDSMEEAEKAEKEFEEREEVQYACLDGYVFKDRGDDEFINIQPPYFLDVSSPNDWFFEGVNTCYEKGYMTGLVEPEPGQIGFFGVTRDLQRQDAAVLLARQYKIVFDNSLDLESGDTYYAAAIDWVKTNGIMTGYENGDFGIGDTITRQDFITALYRFIEKYYSPIRKCVDLSYVLKQYADYKTVSPYALDAMELAVCEHILTGFEKNGVMVLDPQGTINRAMAAAILQRADFYRTSYEKAYR